MRVPASLPALAILAGAALGTRIGGGSPVPGLALLLAAFGLAILAWLARRGLLFAGAIAAVFASGACVLAQRAEAEAADPLIRRELADAIARGPIWLEGHLREDAAPASNGIGLTVDVERWSRDPDTARALLGRSGVRLTVGGAIGLERASEWRAGRLVRVPALLRLPGRNQDPGVPDSRVALARRGVALVGSVKSGALVEVVARGWWGAELAAQARDLARRTIRRHVGRFDPQAEAIVIAILIGDRVGLDDEVQRRLQEAGTYHVIAISGGNIAIVAGVVLWLLRVGGAGHRVGSWVTIAVIGGYAGTVGGGASVARAALMAVIYLVGRQADYRGSPLNALAVAAALLLIASPGSVADAGFWLTFGATLGIMIGIEALGGSLPRARWLRLPAALLLTSVCAELALFPVMARVFSRVTFAGLALNFLAIPLMSVAQIAGMIVVPLSAVSARAADVAGFAAHLGATGLVESAGLVDLAPWLTYRLPPPHAAAVGGYYAGCVAWLAARNRVLARGSAGRAWARLRRGAAVVAAACGAWILVEPATLVAPGVAGRLRVTVIDVGHGDAVLVQLPDRRSFLVDAGGSMGGSSFDIGGRVVSPAVWALRTRRLDALVVSHPDPDHVGGAASVVRDLRPREIWEGVPVPSLAAWAQLRAQARSAGIAWVERHAGDVVSLGDVRLRVRHPPPPDWERQRVRNDDSLVLEFRYGAVSLVLPGDIGRDVERGLAASFEPAGLRVLKIPHHGSATSSSGEFVAALRPRIAILSAGATTKVSEEALRRYEQVGAAVYRTDRDGAVTLETDGRTVTVVTFTGATGVFTK